MSTSPGNGVTFVDALPPSTAGRSGGGWAAVAREALRARPGQWAVVYRAPKAERARVNSKSTTLRLGKQGIGIETAVRTEGDEVVIYARAVQS